VTVTLQVQLGRKPESQVHRGPARGLNQPECQLLSLVVAASESPAQAELSVSESESESVTVAPEGPGVAVGLAAGSQAMRLISESPISVPGSGRPGNLSRLISAATWGAVPRWHEIQPRIISRAQRRVSGGRARPDPERSLRLAAAAA
jgi:hypothetical protein